MKIEFQEGDTYSYISATQGYLVVWTRDSNGRWTASDEQATGRGDCDDDYLRTQLGEIDGEVDAAYARRYLCRDGQPYPPVEPRVPSCKRGAVYQTRTATFRGPWRWECDDCGRKSRADDATAAHSALSSHFKEGETGERR